MNGSELAAASLSFLRAEAARMRARFATSHHEIVKALVEDYVHITYAEVPGGHRR